MLCILKGSKYQWQGDGERQYFNLFCHGVSTSSERFYLYFRRHEQRRLEVFSFNVSPANKLVRISYIGYKTIVLPAKECMTVLLEPSEQSMKEVVVTATRPTFKLDKGMFISNIQGTVYSKLGKAIDVLQQLPMMGSNGVSVLGRGTPLVYINNKLMRSWNELERIPSNMIKEIKIDMNPGSNIVPNVRASAFHYNLKSLLARDWEEL